MIKIFEVKKKLNKQCYAFPSGSLLLTDIKRIIASNEKRKHRENIFREKQKILRVNFFFCLLTSEM